MRILVIGLGVIGTTYAYALQKAGHQTEHWIREEKRAVCPQSLAVRLLDGRSSRRGEELRDTYQVRLAQPSERYDLILISVSSDKQPGAMDTLRRNQLEGPVLLFNGINGSRAELDALMGGREYLLGYPVAGGQLDAAKAVLDSVLFDHIMLESEAKAGVVNYKTIVGAFAQANIKIDCPHDMLEWIWLHMAINAGVITTGATLGDVRDSAAAARRLMDSAPTLGRAVLAVRETIRITAARGVDIHNYKNDLLPYKLPHRIAGFLMKHMFRGNELTRRIMELHINPEDLRYVCGSVYEKGKELRVAAPLFYHSYGVFLGTMKNG